MNLEQQLSLAGRSLSLAVAPCSLIPVVEMFSHILEKAYYWSKGANGVGLLLLQTESSQKLTDLLAHSRYPHYHLAVLNSKGQINKRVPLPPFRVSSNPAIWPVLHNNLSTKAHLETAISRFGRLLSVEPNLISPENLVKSLLSQPSINKQLEFLVKSTRLTNALRLSRLIFCNSLQEQLFRLRPGSTVLPFGSLINGLGSNSSDLDVIIDINPTLATDLLDIASVDFVDITSSLNYSSQTLSHYATQIPVLLRYQGSASCRLLGPVKHLLLRFDYLSCPESRIYGRSIPIINIPRHRVLGIGVDISRSNTRTNNTTATVLGAAFWMQSFVFLMPELIFLATALKYMMRGAQLTSTGPGFGFTNYKLVSLLIHYLQVNGLLPSLEYLMQDYSDDPNVLSREILLPLKCVDSTCPSTAALFLSDFITYMKSLKPATVSLCLRSGRLVPRSDEDLAELGPSSSFHFVHCPDPLRPHRNITHGIDETDWIKFIGLLDVMQLMLNKSNAPQIDPTALWGLPVVAKQYSSL